MNKKSEEYIDFGVDSRYSTIEEKTSNAGILMQARLERMKNLPKEQIIRTKLIQLKLEMDEFLKQGTLGLSHKFSDFLGKYIDILYTKHAYFSKDLNITPVFLSQIINGHRLASEEFLLKLTVHSEKTFETVCFFNKNTWFQIFYQEKINQLIFRQDEWRSEIEKQVKFSELV
ncbi:MAG: hypothetical protein U0V04_16440 [Spirosomataceae bacterium]|jgi:hypothetical protein